MDIYPLGTTFLKLAYQQYEFFLGRLLVVRTPPNSQEDSWGESFSPEKCACSV